MEENIIGYITTVFDGDCDNGYSLAFLVKYSIKDLAISSSNANYKTEKSLILLFN